MNIGERIKKRRKELNYTQKDFAALVGLAPSAISKIESNARMLKPEELSTVAQVLKVSANYILGTEKAQEKNKMELLIEKLTKATNIGGTLYFD